MFPVGSFGELVGGEGVDGEGAEAGDGDVRGIGAGTGVDALQALAGEGEVGLTRTGCALGIPEEHFGVADNAVAVAIGHAAIVALEVVVGLGEFLARSIGVGGEHTEHGVVGIDHFLARGIEFPPVDGLHDVAVAVLEGDFGRIDSVLARSVGVILPELDFAPGIAPSAVAEAFEAAAGGELGVVVPRTVDGRVVDTDEGGLVVVVTHGVDLVPGILEEEAVGGLLVDDFTRLVGSELVVALAEVERVAGHRHVDGRERGLGSLRGYPGIDAVVVARGFLIAGREEFLRILEVLDNEAVDLFNRSGGLVGRREGRGGLERERTEDAHEVVVGVGAPVLGIADGNVFLCFAHGRVWSRVEDDVGGLDDGVVVVPRGGHTFIIIVRTEGIEFGTSLLVGTGVGGDVVALPLGVHHVGPALREVYLFIKCGDAALEGCLGVEVVARGEESLGVFVEEVVARGGHQRSGQKATEDYIVFHNGRF